MDNESQVVLELINHLGAAYHRLTEFARAIRSNPKVKSVSHSVQCLKADYSPATVTADVEVELDGGNALSWDLEVSWEDDRWLISLSINVNAGEWQETMKAFPDRVAATFTQMKSELDDAVSDLVSSAQYIQIAYEWPTS